MNHQAVSHVINGRTLTIETGEIAKQANGSAVVRYGDTMVLAATTAAPEDRGVWTFSLSRWITVKEPMLLGKFLEASLNVKADQSEKRDPYLTYY